MRTVRFAVLAAFAMLLPPLHAAAQVRGASNVPDITGSWERYGARGAAAAQRDATMPPPAPQPPLKPEYLKEWQTKNQAAREADAKGTPQPTQLCVFLKACPQ